MIISNQLLRKRPEIADEFLHGFKPLEAAGGDSLAGFQGHLVAVWNNRFSTNSTLRLHWKRQLSGGSYVSYTPYFPQC